MQVRYDRARLEAEGLAVQENEDYVAITLPEEIGSFMLERSGEDLLLFPERSAAHRRIRDILERH